MTRREVAVRSGIRNIFCLSDNNRIMKNAITFVCKVCFFVATGNINLN